MLAALRCVWRGQKGVDGTDVHSSPPVQHTELAAFGSFRGPDQSSQKRVGCLRTVTSGAALREVLLLAAKSANAEFSADGLENRTRGAQNILGKFRVLDLDPACGRVRI